MAGVERIYFPGEIEQVMRKKRLAKGIPFTESEIASLNEEADMVGSERLRHG
jgi:LDH2 family malate/lactate/ureidoglycolate dehydrogenase